MGKPHGKGAGYQTWSSLASNKDIFCIKNRRKKLLISPLVNLFKHRMYFVKDNLCCIFDTYGVATGLHLFPFLPYFNPDNRSTDPSIDSGCSVVHGERSSELTPKTCRTITTKSAFICVQKKIPLLLNYYQKILPCDILYFKQSYLSTDRISSHLFLLLYVSTYDKISPSCLS